MPYPDTLYLNDSAARPRWPVLLELDTGGGEPYLELEQKWGDAKVAIVVTPEIRDALIEWLTALRDDDHVRE